MHFLSPGAVLRRGIRVAPSGDLFAGLTIYTPGGAAEIRDPSPGKDLGGAVRGPQSRASDVYTPNCTAVVMDLSPP